MARLAAAFIAGCVPANEALAAQHYVDNALTGAGDGQSWATAWRSFAQIDWQAIDPGDTLNISGGSSSQVYLETLTVDASGTSSQPITIRTAVDAGHDGEVVIDAENSRYWGVVIDGVNHVVVRGFKIRNVDDAGMRIRWISAGVIVEDNAVDAGNPTSVDNTRGFDVRNSSGVIVRRNAYSTPASSTAQTDGIWSSNNDGVRFEANQLIISNSYVGSNQGHNDCFQSYLDKNITVVGNFCHQDNAKTGHSLGIFVQNIKGTAYVFNNVVVSPNTNSACIAIENTSGFGTTGRMVAYNNSAYGCAYGTLHIVSSPNTIARNNILVSPKANAQAVKLVPPLPSMANVDYNFLYTPGSSRPGMIAGSGLYTWAEWQTRGYDANGRYGDPAFAAAATGDLTLQPTSDAIDNGTSSGAPTTDHDGTSRPQGGGVDIGAFEY